MLCCAATATGYLRPAVLPTSQLLACQLSLGRRLQGARRRRRHAARRTPTRGAGAQPRRPALIRQGCAAPLPLAPLSRSSTAHRAGVHWRTAPRPAAHRCVAPPPPHVRSLPAQHAVAVHRLASPSSFFFPSALTARPATYSVTERPATRDCTVD